MKVKAVIFDLYGTLIDLFSPEDEQSQLSKIAAELRVPFERFSRLWTETYPQRVTGAFPDVQSYLRDLCKRLRTEPCESGIPSAIELIDEFTRRLMVPRRDAETTLTRLRQAGLKLALLTNCWFEAPAHWNRTSLSRLMDVTVFSFEVKAKKPDAIVYLLTCERLDVQPSECVFVGDGGNQELEGAQAVGMTAVMIRTPDDNLYNPRRTASDDWPGLRISHLSEVPEIAVG
ncbi:MAG: HAD-IA family hydrolase [Candidatus Coatesbacteria bacterium]|nr:HAD-IA family hydrolase [Candidatus Coatesbacteria bacterium]